MCQSLGLVDYYYYNFFVISHYVSSLGECFGWV